MWVITKFNRVGDERLVDEFPMPRAKLSELQDLFGRPRTDPMPECYPIRRKHLTFIESRLGTKLSFDQFDYFLEQRAETAESAKPIPIRKAARKTTPEIGRARRVTRRIYSKAAAAKRA